MPTVCQAAGTEDATVSKQTWISAKKERKRTLEAQMGLVCSFVEGDVVGKTEKLLKELISELTPGSR
jgi:hypothetical protein